MKLNEFVQERHAALANALEKTVKQIATTQNLDFKIMEQEFAKQGYRDNQPSGVENILIFRLDYMGDFILSTPVIREIRMNYPNAFITLVVNKAVYSMAELCPYVNEVIPMEVDYVGFSLSNDIIGMLAKAVEFSAQYLWKRNYTMCICLRHQGTLLDLFLNYLSGAKERIGHVLSITLPYQNPKQKPEDIGFYFLTLPIIHPPEITHVCAKNLYILKAMGLQVRQTNTELWYNAEDLFTARKLLEGFAPNRLKIVVGLGANVPARRYPIEKYLIAFEKILNKGGSSLIIVGGPAEAEEAKFLEKKLPKGLVKNLAGKKLGWRIDAATTSLCDMYIGNDTGTVHIAAAAHLPVIKVCREAEDKINDPAFKAILSEYVRFHPWQTNSITLRPKHALGECQKTVAEGGCKEWEPHCITQIEPTEIVAAYETFANLIRNSKIKKTSCPQIISSVNQVPALYSNITNP